jgi:hypothetical protein
VIRFGLRHFVALAAALALAAYAWLFTRAGADPPIRSDGYNYYVYAPSLLIYHDLSLDRLALDWNGGPYPAFTGIIRSPATGRWMNRLPIGVALLMLPFIVVADLLTRWGNFPRDGFSFYYQHAAALSGLAYFLAGLAVLRQTLSRHFGDGVVLATLAAVTWGTNLFHYAVYDGTFSHAFSFALICAFVDVVDRWWTMPERWHPPALGILLALIVLVRHTNGIVILLLPVWKMARWSDLRRRVGELSDRRGALLVIAGIAAVGVAPQLALYKWTTGQWLPNPYAIHGLGFTFASPHLFGALLSTERGLFFWSPVLLLAAAGAFVADRWASDVRIAVAAFLAANAWVIASWSEWQYGASFGHRAFIDSLGLAAIFLASFFSWAGRRGRATLTATAAAATVAIALSTVQMIQYWHGVWPTRDITWAQYRALFLTWR